MSSESRLSLLCGATLLLTSCASIPGSDAASAPTAEDTASSSTASGVEDSGGGDGGLEQPSSIFLSVLPIRVSEPAKAWVARAEGDDDFAKGLRVRIELLQGYRTLGELTGRTDALVVNGIYRLTDLTQLEAKDAPTPAQKRSSFVIDFDEPVFSTPIEQLKKASQKPKGDAPHVTPEQIRAFVSAYIDHKTYSRGFDIASRVATTRSGDCTEHAVLTAALLRHFGYAARLVFGVVLVGLEPPGDEASIVAAGHAWVEVHHEGRWRIVDAALYVPEAEPGGSEAVGVPGLPSGATLRLAYLPVNVMGDEGPGYSRALLDEVGVDGIVNIEIDAVR